MQFLAQFRVSRHGQLHRQCESVEGARAGGGAQDCGARVEHWLSRLAPGRAGLDWRGRVLPGNMLGEWGG